MQEVSRARQPAFVLSPRMPRYVIGLGSNLGAREKILVGARRAIAELGTVLASSQVYATAPVGPPQPDFVNAAVALETSLAPRALLDATLAVERVFGRVRVARWGPRTLDLDLLLAAEAGEELRIADDALTIPHVELEQRAFALAPLLDVLAPLGLPASRREALEEALARAGGRPPLAPHPWPITSPAR